MRRALALLALCLATPVHAGKLKKMGDAELAKLTADASADEDHRLDAIELLLERRAVGQASVMVGACQPTDLDNVCEHVLATFEDWQDEAALAQVEVVLMHRELDDSLQHKALKILRKLDPYRIDVRVPDLLVEYRKLASGFAVDLISALPERKLVDWQDITILIATDSGAKRRVRLEALEAAEAFGHPALYDAWISLLGDEDKRVRARCAKNLGRSGLPATLVRPALVDVAQTDDAGTVRASALNALRYYADPVLLPLLHQAVLGEKHPVAWGHAMELLEPLADDSSISTLCQLLQRQEYLTEEGVIRIARTMVRIGEPEDFQIGDPESASCLQVLERATANERVRAEARAAIELLGGPPTAREQTVSGWETVEYHLIDPSQPEPERVELGVGLDANGMAVWASVPAE